MHNHLLASQQLQQQQCKQGTQDATPTPPAAEQVQRRYRATTKQTGAAYTGGYINVQALGMQDTASSNTARGVTVQQYRLACKQVNGPLWRPKDRFRQQTWLCMHTTLYVCSLRTEVASLLAGTCL